MKPPLKKTITKKGWWSGSSCRPWAQAPVSQKKKKNADLFVTLSFQVLIGSLSLPDKIYV
jgi:hypothetical protein